MAAVTLNSTSGSHTQVVNSIANREYGTRIGEFEDRPKVGREINELERRDSLNELDEFLLGDHLEETPREPYGVAGGDMDKEEENDEFQLIDVEYNQKDYGHLGKGAFRKE